MKVLGIDPGSRLLGFGIVSRTGSRLKPEAYGTLKFDTQKEANERLLEVYLGVKNVLTEHRPTHVAIEKVFFAKNALSALKLGQARGVAILAVIEANIPLFEYSPNLVKQSVVGFGHADKDQVARMVARFLHIQDFASTDTSDALAIAICHLHTYNNSVNLQKSLARNLEKNPERRKTTEV